METYLIMYFNTSLINSKNATIEKIMRVNYDGDGYPISIETSFLESLEETRDSYIVTNKITQKKTIIRKVPKNVIFK